MAQSKKPNSRVKTKPRIEFEEQPKKVKDPNKINDLDRPKPLKTAISNEDIAKGIKPARKNSKKVVEVTDRIVKLAMKGAEVIQEEKRLQAEAEATAKRERKALEKEMRTNESVKNATMTLSALENRCDEIINSGIYSFSKYLALGQYIVFYQDIELSSKVSYEQKEKFKAKAVEYSRYLLQMWLDLNEKTQSHKFTLYFSQMKDNVKFFTEHCNDVDNETINNTKEFMKLKKLYIINDDGSFSYSIGEYVRYFYYSAFRCLARHGRSFLAFLFANEWQRKFPKGIDYNKTLEADHFIYRRYKVLIKHGIIQAIQNLIDGKKRKTVIEAPPNIGKSLIGISYILFKFGLDPLSKQLIGSADIPLAKKFFNAILQFINSGEYMFLDIFPDCKKILTDGEDLAIYSKFKRTEPNFLMASIMKGATGKQHPNQSGGVYCDDMVSKTEQITAETMSKIYTSFISTFFERVEDETVPFLIIGTPWGRTCPISRFIQAFKYIEKVELIDGEYTKVLYDNPYFEHICVPAYTMNDLGEEITNFPYDKSKYLSVDFFKEKIYSDPDGEHMAKAKFLMIKLDKATNPFMEYQKFRLRELDDRLNTGEEHIWLSATDIATKINGDYLSSGYACFFPKTGDCYLRDVVHSNEGSDKTLPQVINKHLLYKIELSQIEEKEGTNKNHINYGIGWEVQKEIVKQGGLCNIKIESASGQASKSNRISIFEQEIKGNKSLAGWRFLFLHEDDIRNKPDYRLALKHLTEYHYEIKKNDDFCDMLAIIGAKCIKFKAKKAEVYIGALPL